MQLVKDNRDQIVADLKDICVNDRLNIYFLSEPLDVEYCIHNAADKSSAKMYVKHREEYIEWLSGEEANGFWCETKEKKGADDPVPRDALFYGVRGFNLKKEAFYRPMHREMLNYFPDIGDQMLELCLKGVHGSPRRRPRADPRRLARQG
jgi:hypothetical protein